METRKLSINALQPVLIAAPYQEAGSRQRELVSEEFETESTRASEKVQRVERVHDAELVESRKQQGQQKQATPFLPGRILDPSPRTMPGPQILTALIERMGGAGVNSGPGQLIRLSA